MSPWLEDFTTCTLEEVLGRRAQNRAWSKELRTKINTLVNNRLAKSISLDDYLAYRKLAHEDTEECRRRAELLNAYIARSAGTTASGR
jgi:hypothetical protein